MVKTMLVSLTIALSLALNASAEDKKKPKQGIMGSAKSLPVEEISIIQNPDNPEESAVILKACGKQFVAVVPTQALVTQQDQILEFLVGKVEEACGKEI